MKIYEVVEVAPDADGRDNYCTMLFCLERDKAVQVVQVLSKIFVDEMAVYAVIEHDQKRLADSPIYQSLKWRADSIGNIVAMT